MTQGRVVLLTGATSAIGAAITARFLATGHCVFATGASPARLAALPDTPGLARHVADLADAGTRDAAADACLARFGRIDVVVHCAGSSTPMDLAQPDWTAWRREFAVNVEALAALAARGLADMRGRGWGRIIAIGSIYGSLGRNAALYDPGTWRPAYAGSKGALVNLVRDLAATAGGFGVTANCVSPGMIDIPTRPIPPDRAARMAAMTPVGRLGTPEDMVGAVAFLASDEAAFITGVDLLVDGGWSAW